MNGFLKRFSLKGEFEREEMINELEEIYDSVLPDWYKDFLSHDFKEVIFEIYHEEYKMWDFTEFLSLEDIKDELENHEHDKVLLFKKNLWIPLGHDNGGGDYYFIDIKNIRVIQVFHDSKDEISIVSPDFNSFLNKLKVV